MTMDELRAWLESAGFKTSQNGMAHEENHAQWYAYRRTHLPARTCECNDDKPMQIVIRPYEFDLGATQYRSAEVSACGAYGDGQWWELKAYSINPDDLPAKLDGIEKSLIEAWNALADTGGIN